MKKFLYLFGIGLILSGCSTSYSNGFRVGRIQKITTKGLVFKTVEGELAVEGSKTTKTADSFEISSTWEFSVLDKNVKEKLEQAGDKKVKIFYNQWMIKNPLYMSTSYEAVNVEVFSN